MVRSLAFLALLLLACGTSPGPGPDPDGGTAGDADGDTILDADEGAPDLDTDGDGQPDFRDPDADGDGLSDALEAGDADPSTPPPDSDGDGTPDFQDLDADGNGLEDSVESTEDLDEDGLRDYADPDDDGDGIDDAVELAGRLESPPDTDGDGTPDFRDIDADGDAILDREEGERDWDADGVPSFLDPDADGDGIDDATEAGDDLLSTPPVDTDGDGSPDYIDLDSDDDGLVDDLEISLGTDPRAVDSDGDTVSDLIELVAESDPTDREDSPRSRGDFVFEVPFQEPAAPGRDTLQFRTGIRAADLYFSFDTSTTMIQETAALRDPVNGVPGIIDALRCAEGTVVCAENDECEEDEVCGPRGFCAEDPAENQCLLDLHTGVGRWDHVDSFRNLLSVQADPAATAAAIPSAPDFWVAPLQAVACVADGDNCANGDISCASNGVGCPGFREDAVRILVHITDANDECLCGIGTVFPCDSTQGPAARCGTFTTAFAGAELRRKQIQLIGLIGDGPAYGEGDAFDQTEAMGVASGSVDGAGEAFVYSATDNAVVAQTVAAVRDIVSDGQFEYAIEPSDEPGDDGDALRFIERLEVNTLEAGCTTSARTIDTNADTYDDVYQDVRPGDLLCWDIVVRRNENVRPTREPQIFRARLSVFADRSLVDARVVYFLIPADVTFPEID